LSYNVCHEFRVDEEHLNHPDVELESVTTRMLFKICFASILIFIIVAETFANGLSIYGILDSVINLWQYFKYVIAGMYWAGVFLWIVKLRIGRLRPCFLAGCKISNFDPQDTSILLNVSKCTNTDYHYYCQSFFSGHTMLAFYSFMSLVGYVYHRKVRWSSLFYGVLIAVPSWIGFTRIIDNQHHPSDVAAGACVGSLFALFTFFLVNN
jgi:membrane-associated phospholipid phosphatase